MKILYIHNKAMWYRVPYFNKLSEIYSIKFVFTDENNPEGLTAPYVLLKSYGRYPFNITLGLLPLLIKEKYDLIVFPSIVGPLLDQIACLIVAKIKNKPYIWGSDRFFTKKKRFSIQGIKNQLSDLLFGLIARNANAYFVPSEKHRDYPLSLGVPKEKIFIIPNASEINFNAHDIEKAEILRKSLKLKGKKIVLFVGRLIKIKGIEYLLEAMSILKNEIGKNIILLIVGDEYFKRDRDYIGDELKNICKLKNIDDAVNFIGNVDHGKLAPFYILCDILVLPSITLERKEAWGLVLNEAMGFGKPVISTDAVGAAYSLIKDGKNGFIVSEKNADALATAIKEILKNDNSEVMGRNSKEIIANGFTYNHMVNAFKKIVEKASGQ